MSLHAESTPRFVNLVKNNNVSEIQQYLEEFGSDVCLELSYDKSVRHAIATKNFDLVDVLIGQKNYTASDQTFKIVANMHHHDIFNKLLDNINLSDKDKINFYHKLALKSENIECARRLLERKQKIEPLQKNSNVFSGNDDVVDAPFAPEGKSQSREKVSPHAPPEDDSLESTKSYLRELKSKTNPLHLLLNEDNPLKSSIKCHKEIIDFAKVNRLASNKCEKLAKNCQEFAENLLNYCEKDEEIICLLDDDETDASIYKSTSHELFYEDFFNVVINPKFQHYLKLKWHGNENNTLQGTHRILHILLHVVLFPFFSIYNAIRIPKRNDVIAMHSFLYFVTSYVYFLGFLLYSVFYEKIHKVKVAGSFTLPDYIVAVWILAYTAQTFHDFIVIRFQSLKKSWWMWYQIVMITCFIATGICNFVAILLESQQSELHWHASCWHLISEGIYAIAIILAFMRILEWLHLTSSFGHVVVSLSQMTNAILRLLAIFVIVLFSFSFGMYKLYKDFRPREGSNESDNEIPYFTRYVSTLKVLFWVIFNYGEPDYVVIPSTYYWNQNESEELISLKLKFTMVLGYIIWALFHVAFAILLLNMLIAIMTTAYESIMENSDSKTKLAKTKLMMYYLVKHHVVPPPFNILMYVTKLIKFIISVFQKCKKQTENDGQKPTADQNRVKKEHFAELINTLTERYEEKTYNQDNLQLKSKLENLSYVETRKQILESKHKKQENSNELHEDRNLIVDNNYPNHDHFHVC